jgi:hypothetical protein
VSGKINFSDLYSEKQKMHIDLWFCNRVEIDSLKTEMKAQGLQQNGSKGEG